MLELTCEKDVGMGLCMFNFVIMLSLHLVSGFFGTSIVHLFTFFENVFLYLFLSVFSYKIYISYYTHSRAIRENIARVQGCIFTSPKDE